MALGRSRLVYGEWLQREGRRVDAREQLRAAHEILAQPRMEAYAERARRELLATGETVRKRSVEAIDDLTPQEGQIARLAATGHTNPEIGAQLFLSPRTVEWHLRKVFGKLGITSRRQLPDRPARRARPRGPRARLSSDDVPARTRGAIAGYSSGNHTRGPPSCTGRRPRSPAPACRPAGAR